MALSGLALLVPGAGLATTAPDITTNVRVLLTDHGVVFKPAPQPDTDTTFVVQVVNQAKTRRSFRLASRGTRLLGPGGKQLFYYSFHLAGTVDWKSVGVGAPLYHGKITVKVAKQF